MRSVFPISPPGGDVIIIKMPRRIKERWAQGLLTGSLPDALDYYKVLREGGKAQATRGDNCGGRGGVLA